MVFLYLPCLPTIQKIKVQIPSHSYRSLHELAYSNLSSLWPLASSNSIIYHVELLSVF